MTKREWEAVVWRIERALTEVRKAQDTVSGTGPEETTLADRLALAVTDLMFAHSEANGPAQRLEAKVKTPKSPSARDAGGGHHVENFDG